MLAMYVRIKTNPSKTSWRVMLCRSRRHGTSVKQEVVKYLGTAKTKEQLMALRRVGLAEIHVLTRGMENECEIASEDPCEGAALGKMIEIARITEGFHEVFGRAYDLLGLAPILDSKLNNRLRDLVIARIAAPMSKRATSRTLSTHYGKDLPVDTIYRSLDQLTNFEEAINSKIFDTTKHLCPNCTIELLLFDVTTLYFESQKSDELKDFGYSKDHKVGEVQVVLALATTSEGLPIGYELFSGKTAEVKTLLACLTKWRENFSIQNVCVVADRAMMSEENLATMEGSFLRYTVAAKLRTLPKKLRDEILSRRNEVEHTSSGERLLIQEHFLNGRRLIVSYSEARAQKDRSDRERLLSRLSQSASVTGVSTRSLITNRGYRKYFHEAVQGKMVLDEQVIEEEARWDGLHGVIANDTISSPSELLERYRRLWVIEESFRINKNTLEMRPIFHYKPRRIRAHILLCYVAFAVARYTQRQIGVFHEHLSIERIRESLNKVEASILEDRVTGERYRLPSSMSDTAKGIYKSLGFRRSTQPSKIHVTQRKCSAHLKKLSPCVSGT